MEETKMVSSDLICKEKNGGISFGDYKLSEKTKVEDFPIDGDLYKVKTFSEITKLEKNGLFLYESVPGTKVVDLVELPEGVKFTAFGDTEVQITVELMEESSYEVFVNKKEVGNMNTNLGGKLSLSVDLSAGKSAHVNIKKLG
jgi:hypothetical protein